MVAIALANQKGGVGKTTTTLGLAEAACIAGLRVLVIDCDPQANATSGLAVEVVPETLTLADLLEEEREITDEEFQNAILSSPWTHELNTTGDARIDVIVSHPRLATLETQLASDPIGACDRLAMLTSKLSSTYDIILMDCPPSMGLLTINALFAADEVLIVSAPSAWSSDGVEAFVKNVERIAARRSGKPEIAGIIVNNVGRTRDGKYWETEISERHSFKVASITSRAAIAESAAMSLPLTSLGARPGADQGRQNFSEVFFALIGLGAQPQEMKSAMTERVAAKSIAAAV